MIISRKEKKNMSYIESILSSRVDSIVNEVINSDKTYLDEIYRMIDGRIEELQKFGTIDHQMISVDDFVESSYFNDFAVKAREMSDMAFPTINNIYSELKLVFDNIFTKGEAMAVELKTNEDIVKKVESNVKRNVAINSVKDEATVIESFLNKDLIDSSYVSSSPSSSSGPASGSSSGSDSSGNTAGSGNTTQINTSTQYSAIRSSSTGIGDNTLGFDFAGGYITLYPVTSTRTKFGVGRVTVNKPKGNISRPAKSRKTMDFITNGYFYTRVFSPSPVFETADDADVEPIYDSNLMTSYTVEYNTVYNNDNLTLSMDISFGEAGQRVDKLIISLDPGSLTGVLSTNNNLPYISKILVNGKDITVATLDNSISIRDTVIGEIERGFSICPPNVFPTASLNLCQNNVTDITIELTCDTAQTIFYPEKVLLNSAKKEFYRFNYFETLILDEYQSDESRPDPVYMYTEDEIAQLGEIMTSAAMSYNEQIKLNRYAISIKDIEIYSNIYNTSGVMTSNNLNKSGRNIASVEIYSNEVIPEMTSIKYLISADKSVWYPIVPSNRSTDTDDTTPIRIVYGGIESKDGDNNINILSDKVFLKIEMTGTEQTSPYIKSYVARIKLR